jgi:hypothetical protein
MRTNGPVLRLTAPKHATDLRVDACCTMGSLISGGRIAKRKGYEGVVAKDLSSPYVQARSKYWLKVKVHQEDELVISGYTKP